MLYKDLLAAIRPQCEGADWEEYGVVIEGGEPFELVAIHSGESASPKDVIITAGFHGEEQAGPITMMKKTREILDYAAERGVNISLYPCVNPSGFQDVRRYNRGYESPNNAFLEYEVRPGVWIGELPPGIAFRRVRPFHGMPRETKALYERVKNEEPLAFLDLHQDFEFSASRTYAYIFGSRAIYVPIIEATRKWVEIITDMVVDNGSYSHVKVATDAYGLTEFNDGSIIDYFWRSGTDYVATVETSTTTPMDDAVEVNMVWVKAMIDLAAKKKYGLT